MKLVTLAMLAAFAWPAAALADVAACCQHEAEQCSMPCCQQEKSAMACCQHETDKCTMPCCQHDQPIDGVELLLSLGDGMTTAEELFPPAARQRGVVWFHRPVWVGRNVLMGKYIIEHDTDRQARGEPCTFIYAANEPDEPVVSFHCTHLEGVDIDHSTVAVQPTGDGGQKLLWFQFAGETAAHGYPAR
jgi:hypothetical protein